MNVRWAMIFALALMTSGCTQASQDANAILPDGEKSQVAPDNQGAGDSPLAADKGLVHLRGHAFTPSLQPIGNATIAVVALDSVLITGTDGAFDFGKLDRRIYTLTGTATGYLPSSLTVTPEQASDDIQLVLERAPASQPYNLTVQFRGLIECALEAVIISPSCDSALTVVPGAPRPFRENQSFIFGADLGWKTLVVDVVFDGEAHPGLDGLRLVLRGALDPDSNGTYQQYGRWHDAESFSIHLEPGGTYPEGVETVPMNATGFKVDVYPHSHAYQPGEVGILGLGLASNVEFEVYATLFYVEPAPAGWTFSTFSEASQ